MMRRSNSAPATHCTHTCCNNVHVPCASHGMPWEVTVSCTQLWLVGSLGTQFWLAPSPAYTMESSLDELEPTVTDWPDDESASSLAPVAAASARTPCPWLEGCRPERRKKARLGGVVHHRPSSQIFEERTARGSRAGPSNCAECNRSRDCGTWLDRLSP
jgi:hypothetical protein